MDGDELAGVADLFGGLTRSEFEDALDELAFKRGDDFEGESSSEDGNERDVDAALHGYYLIAADYDGLENGGQETDTQTILAPGPVAFPELPAYATDLPHILDVERRDIDRDVLAETVRERLETEAGDATGERAEYLLDVTYDAEAWAPLELDDVREELSQDL